jgi:glycosyltransferase involved in cell wall biosynthesis
MKTKVSIIIPAKNESDVIVRTIREIVNLREELPEIEIIVVDGGSSDGTAELAEAAGAKVIRHTNSLGYGQALRTGFENALGDIIVTYDAEGTYDPKNISTLIRPILEGSADLVIGSRFKGEIKHGAELFPSYISIKFLTKLMNLLCHTHLTDSLSSFRAIRKDSLNEIECKEDDYTIFLDFSVKSHKAGLRIIEVPVTVRPRFIGAKFKIKRYRSFSDFLRMIRIIIGGGL